MREKELTRFSAWSGDSRESSWGSENRGLGKKRVSPKVLGGREAQKSMAKPRRRQKGYLIAEGKTWEKGGNNF